MRAVLIVMSDAVEGRDDEYNDWYDRVHLADVLALPGFVAARRYVAEPSVHGELPAQRYLAVRSPLAARRSSREPRLQSW